MAPQLQARRPAGLFHLRAWFEYALDLLYPPCCEHCGHVDTRWCARCARALLEAPLCPVERYIPPFAQVVAAGPHTGIVRDALHSLKYSHHPTTAELLGQRLAALVTTLSWPVQACLPVPLHRDKLRKRGYNQSELLAQGLAASTHLPLLVDALQRERNTHTQVGLTRTERMRNVTQAFRCTTRFHGETLLLIDDVCTTGATLAACAEALLTCGAGALYAVTVTTATIRSQT